MIEPLALPAIVVFMGVTALFAIRSRELPVVAMLFGLFSLLSAALFVLLDAPDVAFTEAAVGAGISTVLVLSALSIAGTRERRPAGRRVLPLVLVLVTGGALFYGTLEMPRFGDPAAPANGPVAARYIADSPREIGIPNMVTSVLASYRGYDTLGEVVVIFTAGLAVLVLVALRERRRPDGP